MTDLFISYNSADKDWAEWMAFVLEESGLTVVIQAWDFRPGSNFVLEMQAAADRAARTIMVLSPDYLKSQFAAPEWAAAFSADPQGLGQKLVPVMVRSCEPTGLLKSLVHIDLRNLTEEDARQTLLDGPAFPGVDVSPHKPFPGQSISPAASTAHQPYIPKGLKAASDADKRRYMRRAFDTISSYFREALPVLAARGGAIDVDFDSESATDFRAEIFMGGKSVAACRVWRSDEPYGDGICFAEGRQHLGRNSYNEILSVADEGGELGLASMMSGFAGGRTAKDFNMKHLTEDQAAEYLWRRLVERLER